jgi:CBS-domain-containing membrane protein
MMVRDLMQRDLRTVASDATIAEAVDALVAAHVSALPVLDRLGRAVGVIAARDILQAERAHPDPVERERLFDESLVLEVMQAWVATVAPETEVRAAAERMLHLGTQRLFVEEDGALVGVISMTDVARAYALATA